MGHPLNAAMWLAQALKKEGISLKKGDLLSLGSFFPAMPLQSGTNVQVQYLGMPGDPSVSVEFN
jgi:2-keto-4-pentenoate hydratase